MQHIFRTHLSGAHHHALGDQEINYLLVSSACRLAKGCVFVLGCTQCRVLHDQQHHKQLAK